MILLPECSEPSLVSPDAREDWEVVRLQGEEPALGAELGRREGSLCKGRKEWYYCQNFYEFINRLSTCSCNVCFWRGSYPKSRQRKEGRLCEFITRHQSADMGGTKNSEADVICVLPLIRQIVELHIFWCTLGTDKRIPSWKKLHDFGSLQELNGMTQHFRSSTFHFWGAAHKRQGAANLSETATINSA